MACPPLVWGKVGAAVLDTGIVTVRTAVGDGIWARTGVGVGKVVGVGRRAMLSGTAKADGAGEGRVTAVGDTAVGRAAVGTREGIGDLETAHPPNTKSQKREMRNENCFLLISHFSSSYLLYSSPSFPYLATS
jgi:hypothetical protein